MCEFQFRYVLIHLNPQVNPVQFLSMPAVIFLLAIVFYSPFCLPSKRELPFCCGNKKQWKCLTCSDFRVYWRLLLPFEDRGYPLVMSLLWFRIIFTNLPKIVAVIVLLSIFTVDVTLAHIDLNNSFTLLYNCGTEFFIW